MALRIEDYALIGDTQTAALVGNDGSVDWLCMPRFDSDACFAALLGDERHGRWVICPEGKVKQVRRRYRPGTLVLETELEVDGGAVRLVDLMPIRGVAPDIVRIVEGVRGQVPMRMALGVRFGFGAVRPWRRRLDDGRLRLVAGPDSLTFNSLDRAVKLEGEPPEVEARFALSEGQRVAFTLTWNPSHEAPPKAIDADVAERDTQRWWEDWSKKCVYEGPWREEVLRSAITLKALTYMPTGGIVAAATTSLPEKLGGVRNWDYRFCWLRDATFTLYALMNAGYAEEAKAWRDWLLRAVAGEAADLQIMYGPAGERRLPEQELDWLPGYEGSRPVRIGNGAVEQLQLDVYGELLDCLHQALRKGIGVDEHAWELQRGLIHFLEKHWDRPDEGIWEVRGPRRDFTHSKVMAWVAMDRAVRSAEHLGLPGAVERWKQTRKRIHAEVCREGYDPKRKTFTQFYGSKALDASLLLIPLVGFLPASDERVLGTVAAIERELFKDGFVMRYRNSEKVDGLPEGEGAFLACTFWYADNLAMMGRTDESREIFERLLSLRNDVGLLSEEYDTKARRLVGNFPQAFSHVALINSAMNLSRCGGPAQHRPDVQEDARS